MINFVTQCISINSTWRFACCNAHIQKSHPDLSLFLLLLNSFSKKLMNNGYFGKCMLQHTIRQVEYLKCIASQSLSPPCVLFFLWKFNGRRTRVSINLFYCASLTSVWVLLKCQINFLLQGEEAYEEALKNMKMSLSTILDLKKQFATPPRIIQQIEDIQRQLRGFFSSSPTN